MEKNREQVQLTLQESLRSLLEECRMVLPGIQATFGFQLVAVFNQPFTQLLSIPEQRAHLAALGFMALAIGTTLAPVSFHRLVQPEEVSRGFLRMASHFLTGGMIFLIVGISIDFYLIARIILRNVPEAAVSTLFVFLFLTGLWIVMPLAVRRRRGA